MSRSLEDHQKKVLKELINMGRKAYKTGKPQVGNLHLFGKRVRLELLNE